MHRTEAFPVPRRVRRRLGSAALALVVALTGLGSLPRQAVAGGADYLYVVRWSTRPDQDLLAGSAYTAWSRTAIPRCLLVPGLTGLTTYRAAAGEPHIITLFAFPTLPALAGWRGSRELEDLTEESRQFTYEMTTEIWGPSPYLPAASGSGHRATTAAGHVLYVFAWNVFPGKHEAYQHWVAAALRAWAGGPGIETVTAHRIVVGTRTDVFACEFPSFEAWARWYESADIQRTRAESRELVVDTRTELWGPNPLFPGPVVTPVPAKP